MNDNGIIINLNTVRHSVRVLNTMLDLLHPPPPNVDVITLTDVQNRYPLTGFAAPAIAAIQQSHRILRASKAFKQIGLAEFHTGLIYMYWGYCLEAAQHFAEARHQWQLADASSSVCLTYFAEGCTQHHALHYEKAMGNYGRTEQHLSRLKLAPPSASQDQFIERITTALAEAQEALREKLWPPDEPEPGKMATHETPPPETNEPPAAAEASEEAASVPLPIITLSNGQRHSPIAALNTTSMSHRWYEVLESEDDFLPYIRKGAWLVVDTQVQGDYKLGDLIIIGGNDEDLAGSVPVRPFIHTPPFNRIILSKVQFTGSFTPTGAFTRDRGGNVTLILETGKGTIQTNNVLGIVIGVWFSSWQMAD